MENFTLEVLKEDAPPDAPRHTLRTVGEVFDLLTEENFDRFFSAFQQGMRLAMAAREVARATADQGEGDVRMEAFTWVDDLFQTQQL